MADILNGLSLQQKGRKEQKIMECKKTKYASKEMADEDIDRIRKKSKRSTIPIRSYRCNVCKGNPWHLTSKENMFKFAESEMENKKIAELTEENKKLKEELHALKNNIHNDINYLVKLDAKVKRLNELIAKKDTMLLLARNGNAELIAKIVQLEKLIPKH